MHFQSPTVKDKMLMQIDVENPCVIMSQDKSREFLHSGNDKDKFKVMKAVFFTFW